MLVPFIRNPTIPTLPALPLESRDNFGWKTSASSWDAIIQRVLSFVIPKYYSPVEIHVILRYLAFVHTASKQTLHARPFLP